MWPFRKQQQDQGSSNALFDALKPKSEPAPKPGPERKPADLSIAKMLQEIEVITQATESQRKNPH